MIHFRKLIQNFLLSIRKVGRGRHWMLGRRVTERVTMEMPGETC